MRKVTTCLLLVFLVFVLAVGSARSEDYDISGYWHLRGNGYAEKGVLRVELSDNGSLYLNTSMDEGGGRLLTGYTLEVYLDASKLDINAWKFENEETFRTPVSLPELRPTNNNPFELPAVTVDGLTYKITLTSTTSGVVDIYGDIDLDVVGNVEINSQSKIWKDGTPEPDIEDLSSGCNVGWTSFFVLSSVLVSIAKRKK